MEISESTKKRFLEYLRGTSLEYIEDSFGREGLRPAFVERGELPEGARSGLVAQYYASVNWASDGDVERVLRVFRRVAREAPPPDRDELEELLPPTE